MPHLIGHIVQLLPLNSSLLLQIVLLQFRLRDCAFHVRDGLLKLLDLLRGILLEDLELALSLLLLLVQTDPSRRWSGRGLVCLSLYHLVTFQLQNPVYLGEAVHVLEHILGPLHQNESGGIIRVRLLPLRVLYLAIQRRLLDRLLNARDDAFLLLDLGLQLLNLIGESEELPI